MSTVEQEVPPLVAGDFLSREEFLRRWEATRKIKRAELIGGVVYMPSPLSWDHGAMETRVTGWLAVYMASTPGCEAGNNATWLMLEDAAPQPDTALRLLPEAGGQSQLKGRYASGAPEFLAEVCLSSTAYDLHQKLELYREAGVQEYLAVLMREHTVRWHRRVGDVFEVVPVPEDGIYRSAVFPGLWLDEPALLAGDMAGVLATLQQGLNSAEHGVFVEKLATRREAGR